MRRRPRVLAVVLAAALSSAACGSTLPADRFASGPVGQQGAGGALGDLQPVPGGTGAPVAQGLPAGGAAPGAGGAVPPPQGGPGAGGAAASAGSAPVGRGVTGTANGPGVTATTIALGIPYCADCAAANGALGADGEDPGDERRYYEAALAEVNSRGGVLGRRLVPVFHKISAADNVDVSAQAMCQTFTKDNKVAAIFFRTQIIDECAKRGGIVAVGDSGSGPLFGKYPNLLSPSTLRFEGLAAATVRGMLAAGWQKPTAKWPTGKIGLITWEENDYEYAVTHGWLPALHAAGLQADVRTVAVPQSDRSLADSSSAIAGDVLAFRNEGVDHVFIADGPAGIFRGGGLTLQFLEAAKSQQYFPRYGFNSNNAPGDSALPPDEQSGMLAVDANDLQASNDAGIAPNPQRARCYAVMSRQGLKHTDGKATGLLALGACDIAWFTEAVFSRTHGTTLGAVIAAAESLGTSYRSPFAFGTRLGRGRHDGLTYFRNSRFDDGCSCMRYTSKPYEP